MIGTGKEIEEEEDEDDDEEQGAAKEEEEEDEDDEDEREVIEGETLLEGETFGGTGAGALKVLLLLNFARLMA